jgi:hypothetical protein
LDDLDLIHLNWYGFESDDSIKQRFLIDMKFKSDLEYW